LQLPAKDSMRLGKIYEQIPKDFGLSSTACRQCHLEGQPDILVRLPALGASRSSGMPCSCLSKGPKLLGQRYQHLPKDLGLSSDACRQHHVKEPPEILVRMSSPGSALQLSVNGPKFWGRRDPTSRPDPHRCISMSQPPEILECLPTPPQARSIASTRRHEPPGDLEGRLPERYFQKHRQYCFLSASSSETCSSKRLDLKIDKIRSWSSR
jgi:hypothetical protein